MEKAIILLFLISFTAIPTSAQNVEHITDLLEGMGEGFASGMGGPFMDRCAQEVRDAYTSINWMFTNQFTWAYALRTWVDTISAATDCPRAFQRVKGSVLAFAETVAHPGFDVLYNAAGNAAMIMQLVNETLYADNIEDYSMQGYLVGKMVYFVFNVFETTEPITNPMGWNGILGGLISGIIDYSETGTFYSYPRAPFFYPGNCVFDIVTLVNGGYKNIPNYFYLLRDCGLEIEIAYQSEYYVNMWNQLKQMYGRLNNILPTLYGNFRMDMGHLARDAGRIAANIFFMENLGYYVANLLLDLVFAGMSINNNV